MARWTKDQFEVTQYLANLVGKDNPFMRDIACMSPKWREIRALLEIVEIIDKYEPAEIKMTEEDKQEMKMIKDIVEKIGQAEFQMDIVSHLAMKLGKKSKLQDLML